MSSHHFQDGCLIRDGAKHGQYAEKYGFEAIWHTESRLGKDAITPSAPMVIVTNTITLGTDVINNWKVELILCVLNRRSIACSNIDIV